jgi:chromosome partitioning protein
VAVVTEKQMARYVPQYRHIVIDTEAHPNSKDLRELADGCDLLILPSTPDALALDALMLTVDALETIGARNYRVLLSIVPPRPNHDADDVRAMLTERGLPVFKGEVRRLIAFQKAALAGVPVYEAADPRASDAWADYVAVGEEIKA